jgi:hypothetical protein
MKVTLRSVAVPVGLAIILMGSMPTYATPTVPVHTDYVGVSGGYTGGCTVAQCNGTSDCDDWWYPGFSCDGHAVQGTETPTCNENFATCHKHLNYVGGCTGTLLSIDKTMRSMCNGGG